MLFSDCFNVPLNGNEDWFNPILDDDTLLFVDPFLIYLDDAGIFRGSYQKIMDYFSKIFEEAAITNYNINASKFKVLTSKVVFKEPKEACLGYSIGSVDGAGSGSGFAKSIINAVYDSINSGINNLNHFEELGIFSTNIKEDRISDITINILKEEFISYTQKICESLNINQESLPCRIFDHTSGRWLIKKYSLPRNPFNNGPIILIPKKFLASVNALNSQDFLDYCWEQYDDNVRDQLNVEIKSNIDKNKIIEIAKNNQGWVSSYLKFKEDKKDQTAYDLENDPAGVYKWHKMTENFVTENPIQITVTDNSTLLDFLDIIANKFQIYIEVFNGYAMLLGDNSKPKRERAAQLLLYGLLKNYCKSISCLLQTKEAGKGLINLVFSNGYQSRCFFEIKYSRNNEILKTFKTFLNKTNTGDELILGYYFIVGFKQNELIKALEIEDDILSIAEEYNFQLKYKIINASIG